MADKFDLNSIVGSLKSMINPAGGVPVVDPDDALGMKVAQITTLLKQTSDAQTEQVKNINQVTQLLNAAFLDIQKLRDEVQGDRAKKAAEKPAEAVAKPTEPEKKEK